MAGGQVRRAIGLALLLGAVMAGPVRGQAVPSGTTIRGELAFDGNASLGDFTGTTTTLTGALFGAETLEAVRGWVEAPSRTLVTGNGRRDRDMYKSLEVERYPVLRFDLDALAAGEPVGDSIPVTLRGRFTLHGVSREEAVRGWVWLRDGAVRFRGALPIRLTEYRIGGLSKFLGALRMHEEIVVRVDVEFGR